MKSPVKVIAAVVCEDIRQEATGKFSLAGVFGSSIQTQAIPALLNVGIFAEVKFEKLGNYEVEFRVTDPAGNAPVHGKLSILVSDTDSFPLPFGPFPLQLSSEGSVKVEWKFAGAPWEKLREFNVVKNENISATPFPPFAAPRPKP